MALREILASFDFDIKGGKLKDAKKGVDSLAQSVTRVTQTLVAGALLSGAKQFIGGMIDAADALGDTSAQLGIGVQDLQRWQLGAKLSGVEAEEFNKSLMVLQKNAANAGAAGAVSGGKFKELGVDVRDSTGNFKESGALLRETGLAIANLKSPAERTQAALELFGKSGVKMGPMFNEGAEGLDNLLAELDKLGGGFSDEAIDQLREADDQLVKFEASTTSLKSKMAVELMPKLNQLIDWAIKAVNWLGDTTEGTNVFQAALVVLGAVGAAAGLTMMAPYIPFAILIAIIILLIDDLITFFEGGDSAAQKFLEAIFGLEDGKAISDAMRQDWKDLWDEIGKAPDIASKVEAAFSVIGASLTKFIVDEIPEAWELFWADMNADAETGGKTFIDFYIAGTKAQLGSIKDLGIQLATDYVNGIIEGLEAGVALLEAKAKEISDKVTGAFKINWDSHSPSNVAHDLAFGFDMGLVEGLAKGLPSVTSESQQVAEAVSSSFARTTFLEQNNQISIPLSGGAGRSVLESARAGTSQGLEDARREALAALEVLA